MEKTPLKKIVFLRGETIEGSLPKKDAVEKDSLEIEEGGPMDQVLEIEEGAIEQVQASKRSSQGRRPCHQTDGSARANSSVRLRLGRAVIA